MEIEIWKDIIGYENLYQISNYGNVKSLCDNKGKKQQRILKPGTLKTGYNFVSLYKNSTKKIFYIHRLVGLMFIDNPENKKEINHIDGNKVNNNVNNLEWNTRSENNLHKFNTLNYKIVKGKGKDNNLSKKVNQYDLNNNFIKTWDSIMDIERELHIQHCNISSVCKYKRKTAGGFIWKYT